MRKLREYEQIAPSERTALFAINLRTVIATFSREYGIPVCEIEAELIAQSLMCDDCDQCHVNWLALYDKLNEKLQPKLGEPTCKKS